MIPTPIPQPKPERCPSCNGVIRPTGECRCSD